MNNFQMFLTMDGHRDWGVCQGSWNHEANLLGGDLPMSLILHPRGDEGGEVNFLILNCIHMFCISRKKMVRKAYKGEWGW